MGHNSSKISESTSKKKEVTFGRAKTMLDVSEAQLASVEAENHTGLKKSTSDTALNIQNSNYKLYQQALEWGRNEHFFKLAHTFHTNNY